MNEKIWGIIGGVALLLALLSPLVLGNSKKVERLFEDAEALYERSNYEGAIEKYKKALKESNKPGAKTEHIDRDFATLVNLKIARCYYHLVERTQDVRYYQDALAHIRQVWNRTHVPNHQEELTYLWAEILYRIEDLDQAKSKFSWLIGRFPNSDRVPEALYALGNINVKQENYNEALNAFQKLIDEFSNGDWGAKGLYAIGDIHYKQQNYDEALNAFQKLIDEFPHSELNAETEHRIAELERLYDEPRPDPECEEMYNIASNLKEDEKVYEAYQHYTDLITQFPECKYVTDAYVGIAEIYLQSEDHVNARRNYEEAMRNTDDEERRRDLYEAYHRTYLIPDYPDDIILPPTPTDKLFTEARFLRMEERFPEAAKIYGELGNKNLSAEDTIDALYWMGFCYLESVLQNPDSADVTSFSKSVNAFSELIADYEDNSYTIKSYYYLALIYSKWAKVLADPSKYQLVINTVEEANERYRAIDSPRYNELFRRMQQLKDDAHEKLILSPLDERRQEAEHGIADAEDAIARAKQKRNREPTIIQEAEDHLRRAKETMDNNNYQAALDLAKKALEIIRPEPPSPPTKQHYVEKGHIHLQRDKLEEATREANQALMMDQNCPQARELLLKIKQGYYGRGLRYFDEKKYNKAITAFKNVIEIDPKFKEAYNRLGAIYIKHEKYNEAIENLREATNIDPRFKEAYFNLALAYLELDDFRAAINAANNALSIDPNYEHARMLIEFITN